MLEPLTDAVIEELGAAEGFAYLATPYTRFPSGIYRAAKLACRAADDLMSKGLVVFSPIAHSHAIAHGGALDPLDHAFWMRQCRPLMEAASALIVVQVPGWQASRGVAAEIAFFRESCLPVYGMPYDG